MASIHERKNRERKRAKNVSLKTLKEEMHPSASLSLLSMASAL